MTIDGPVVLALAWITLASVAVIIGNFAIGASSLPFLRDTAPAADGPLVSVIVAARDEGPHITAALQSLLEQEYGQFEVIAVNDRSVDDTGPILDGLAARDPRLRVMHVRQLPAGWLGKNHALHLAAGAAGGELLLFTDADVVFDRAALGRTVAFMQRTGTEHLTLGPALELPTAPLALVVNYFTFWFLAAFQPWRARKPGTPQHLGIGAFNAVDAARYRQVGGHASIAMRPDDDLKLGKILKQAGVRQEVGSGLGVIRITWYASLPECIRGFRKNAFSALGYRTWLMGAATVAQLGACVWPFVALAVTTGAVWWINLATCLLLAGSYAAVAHRAGNRAWLAVFYPVAALIFTWIILASSVRTLVRGGIEWRGTFYPLSELRRNVV
jgi:hypothetical protein